MLNDTYKQPSSTGDLTFNGSHVFVADSDGDRIQVLNQELIVFDEFSTPFTPGGITYDGLNLLISNLFSPNEIYRYSTEGIFVEIIRLENDALNEPIAGMTYNGSHVWATSNLKIYILDGYNGSYITHYPTPDIYSGIAYVSVQNSIWVTNPAENSINQLNNSNGQATGTILNFPDLKILNKDSLTFNGEFLLHSNSQKTEINKIKLDITGPIIEIRSPLENSIVFGDIPIVVRLFDVSNISQVHFMINNELKFVDYQAPYSFTWNTIISGNLSIRVDAYDVFNNVRSDQIFVIVDRVDSSNNSGFILSRLFIISILLILRKQKNRFKRMFDA
jgi:hypothetical protein